MGLVAFDDFEWADVITPGLTTMAQPLQAMADQAVQMVLSRVADPMMPARRVMISPTLMRRDSA